MIGTLLGATALGAVLALLASPRARRVYNQGVPFARGRDPVWPVRRGQRTVSYTDTEGNVHGRRSRAFRASRDDGRRWHAGIDLFASPGGDVVAMEDGSVVGRQTFLGDTWALLVQNDSGVVVLYGEIERPQLGVGTRVSRGQRIAKVGVTPAGTSMLHVETYRRGTTRNEPWVQGRAAPPNLLDPSEYLLDAAGERTA